MENKINSEKLYTYEEFLEIDSKTDKRLEYINGEIICQASPSTIHQTVSVNLTVEFKSYFKDRQCKVFHAPFDIVLKNDKIKHPRKVIPDISIICDKNGLNDKNYIGVPNLIVEILSPSNASYDEVIKLNLYMKFGVTEYWIVYPSKKKIVAYVYDNSIKSYKESKDFYIDDVIESEVFEGLKVNLKDIFE